MKYKIKFTHVRPEDIEPGKVPNKPGTFCYIYTGPDFSLLASYGAAVLHPGDNFNRAVGRKVAADRAISAIPDRAVRSELWNQLAAASPKTIRAGRV